MLAGVLHVRLAGVVRLTLVGVIRRMLVGVLQLMLQLPSGFLRVMIVGGLRIMLVGVLHIMLVGCLQTWPTWLGSALARVLMPTRQHSVLGIFRVPEFQIQSRQGRMPHIAIQPRQGRLPVVSVPTVSVSSSGRQHVNEGAPEPIIEVVEYIPIVTDFGCPAARDWALASVHAVAF